MWKTIKILTVLIIVFVAASYALPRHIHVERMAIINAPAAQIYPHIANLRKQSAWSPWLKRDPTTELEFSGPESGVGAKMAWRSDHPDISAGTSEIIEAIADKLVRIQLDFDAEGTGTASFTLAGDGVSTDVTWGFDTDLGTHPIRRYFGLILDRWLGVDFETGLADLKQIAESQSISQPQPVEQPQSDKNENKLPSLEAIPTPEIEVVPLEAL